MARGRRTRELFILRGMPGSGKSRLARSLTANEGEIYSTDDYYDRDEAGEFVDVRRNLQAAHSWNRERVFDAVRRRDQFIVVDNSNLQKWEMWPYVQMGFYHGYFITILETSIKIPLQTLFERIRGRISMGELEEKLKGYERARRFWDVFYNFSGKRRWGKMDEGRENNLWQ